MQSGDEEVQNTSELDVFKAELATSSVDLKKIMSGMMRPGLWHGPASPFVPFIPLHGCHIQHIGLTSMRRKRQLPPRYLALLKCKLHSLYSNRVYQSQRPLFYSLTLKNEMSMDIRGFH